VLVWATGSAAVANLALNFALIPAWGIFGSAWASIASQATYAVVLAAIACREPGFALPWKPLLAAGAVTGAFVLAWPALAPALAGLGTVAALAAGAALVGVPFAAAWWLTARK